MFLRDINISTCAALTLCGSLLISACTKAPEPGIDPARQELAIQEVEKLQRAGRRVWCVPFARNASGIQIRGNAKTWWGQADGRYEKGDEPQPGSVMAFTATRRNPYGHVAVVSDVLSNRQLLVSHANWKKNRVSLNMSVKDVSENNDWSKVRLESNPGAYGSIYPVTGFIYPNEEET